MPKQNSRGTTAPATDAKPVVKNRRGVKNPLHDDDRKIIDYQGGELPQQVRDLIATSLAIDSRDAKAAGTVGFMARGLTIATMPHREPKTPVFERVNGQFTLSMIGRPSIGLPFGSLPRLLVSWVTTEAVRTKSRELTLGQSLSDFLTQLDLNRSGGKRGDITRLRDQMKRLFSCMISAEYNGKDKWALENIMLVEKAVIFWDPQNEHDAGVWDSSLLLSEPFFRECINHPVPVDMRAFMTLKRSPLALDIYTWLTYRFSYLSGTTTIPWQLLKGQFGADYQDTPQGLRDLRRAYIRELQKVMQVYPNARVEATDHGLVLKPSLTHVPKLVLPGPGQRPLF